MSDPAVGYSEADLEQHGRDKAVTPGESDIRTPFQHDVDRILYSSEFRALAGKTQVVAADQLGGYHNRLTHSLKVAQIGRRLAVLLTERAGADPGRGPDPDLLEAAGLLHDIGHPPFGHIGEKSLGRCVDRLRTGTDKEEEWPDPPSDGFQGNAQNLRIATFLSARATPRQVRGLHLTRATLDAATKYPWVRGASAADHASDHWGVYPDEEEAARWILQGKELQAPPNTKGDVVPRPVEEQIMDWADEVTYACHDVEDFYRAGLIPLDQLFSLPAEENRRQVQLPYETEQFMLHLVDKQSKDDPEHGFDEGAFRTHMREIANLLLPVGPYIGDLSGKQQTAGATSRLITFFLTGVHLAAAEGAETLTRYGATLEIDPDLEAKVKILRELIWFYVIGRPGLAGQQQGQRRIVEYLTAWIADEPTRLLPPDRREEWKVTDDSVRSAADYVSSMTEGQALTLYRRMSGIDYGQITDLL